MTDLEERILRTLGGGDDGWCFSFKGLRRETRDEIDDIRRACRAMRDKGWVYFASGLMDDEGRAAGSGYGITDKGREILYARDLLREEVPGWWAPCTQESGGGLRFRGPDALEFIDARART